MRMGKFVGVFSDIVGEIDICKWLKFLDCL